MKSLVGVAVSALVLIFFAAFAWMHLKQSTESVEIQSAPLIEQARKAQQAASDSQGAPSNVTITGALTRYATKQDGSKSDTIETIAYKPVASDHVGGSVVDTSMVVLKDKFRLAAVVEVPFEVPAHAAMPKLHGTFRSFIQVSGKPSSDTKADIDFRLLSDEEFSRFVNGQPSEPLFSADATHDQNVNASLPPTMNRPVKYHLVFVNDSRATKKVVQPDFTVDF
jgi:hypothetical protein